MLCKRLAQDGTYDKGRNPGRGRQGSRRRGGGEEGAFVTVVAGWDVLTEGMDGDVSKVQGSNGPLGGDATLRCAAASPYQVNPSPSPARSWRAWKLIQFIDLENAPHLITFHCTWWAIALHQRPRVIALGTSSARSLDAGSCKSPELRGICNNQCRWPSHQGNQITGICQGPFPIPLTSG